MTAVALRKKEGQPKAHKRLALAYEREDGSTGVVVGRYAWTLQHLVDAGLKGITPIERPAPRWSHYVHILRKDHSLDIETVEERHKGDFPGTHGRYVLRERIKLRPHKPPKRKPCTGRAQGLQNPISSLAGNGGSE